MTIMSKRNHTKIKSDIDIVILKDYSFELLSFCSNEDISVEDKIALSYWTEK